MALSFIAANRKNVKKIFESKFLFDLFLFLRNDGIAIPIDMMRYTEDTVSIVSPQKCINPATFTNVRTTHNNT